MGWGERIEAVYSGGLSGREDNWVSIYDIKNLTCPELAILILNQTEDNIQHFFHQAQWMNTGCHLKKKWDLIHH